MIKLVESSLAGVKTCAVGRAGTSAGASGCSDGKIGALGEPTGSTRRSCWPVVPWARILRAVVD